MKVIRLIKRPWMMMLALAVVCGWAAQAQATPPRGLMQAGYHGDCGCDAGGEFYEPGCGFEPGCGVEVGCCDPCCRPCCLRIIPAIVRGTGRLLHGLFCCHRCYDPCCDGGCASAGCSDCWGGDPHAMSGAAHWESPSARTNRAYENWSMARQSAPSRGQQAKRVAVVRKPASTMRETSSVVKSKPAQVKKPQKLSTRTAATAKPIIREQDESAAEEVSVVRRTSYNEPASRRIPHNPLRD